MGNVESRWQWNINTTALCGWEVFCQTHFLENGMVCMEINWLHALTVQRQLICLMGRVRQETPDEMEAYSNDNHHPHANFLYQRLYISEETEKRPRKEGSTSALLFSPVTRPFNLTASSQALLPSVTSTTFKRWINISRLSCWGFLASFPSPDNGVLPCIIHPSLTHGTQLSQTKHEVRQNICLSVVYWKVFNHSNQK